MKSTMGTTPFACDETGAAHTFKWAGERVQRETHEANLPQQVAEWRGEPTADEGANATESEPKRTVVVGGRSPGAKGNAATPWVGRASSTMVRQRHQMGTSKTVASQPTQGVAALRAGAPEVGMADRWRSEATKGKNKCADAAYSRINTGKSPLGDRPKVASMVRIYSRRPQSFLWPKSWWLSDYR